MFKEQLKRLDVLNNMLNKYSYESILTNNGKKNDDKRYQGFVYETICIILTITKCLDINFSNIMVGRFEDYIEQKVLKNIKHLLDVPINQGDDKADMTLFNDYKIAFSIKYRDNECADYEKLGLSALKDIRHKNDKIGLIVKDKKYILNHRYTTKSSKSLEICNEIINNNLLFDETDIKNGYTEFKTKLMKDYKLEEYIEYINSSYLNNSRKLLVLKLHQAIFKNKIISNIKNGEFNHLIQNKPRSGKTILMLNIAYDLINILNKKKILIMTSVPSTIKSFIDELNKWDVFKSIKYKEQKDFMGIDKDFNGICLQVFNI